MHIAQAVPSDLRALTLVQSGRGVPARTRRLAEGDDGERRIASQDETAVGGPADSSPAGDICPARSAGRFGHFTLRRELRKGNRRDHGGDRDWCGPQWVGGVPLSACRQ